MDKIEIAYNDATTIEDILRSLRNPNLSKKEINEGIDKALNFCADIKSNLIALFDDFTSIKNQLIDEEAKIKELEENLTTIREKIKKEDIELNKDVCMKKYKLVWELLDEKTKDFIITAHYIFKFLKEKSNDYSPAILEICRAFENELRIKIYSPFIDKKSLEVILRTDHDCLYNAINKTKHGENYFISLSDMIEVLKKFKDPYLSSSTYCYLLKTDLNENNWDVNKLSETKFCDDAKDYTNNFRNKSAHPNIMTKDEWVECSKKTKELITSFFNAKI